MKKEKKDFFLFVRNKKMWPFYGKKENDGGGAWNQNFGFSDNDDMLQPLLQAESMPFGKLPCVEMLKTQRLYGVPDEALPTNIAKETLRDIIRVLFAENAMVFVGRKSGDVFVTSKQIDALQNYKNIPLDSVLGSIHTPPFQRAFCSFLINEILPNLSLSASSRMSFAFLCDFDELLSVRIRSNLSFKFVNFRNLAYRLANQKVTEEELDSMKAPLREKYKILIDLYQ